MSVAHAVLKRMEEKYPERLEGCEYFCGDKGYDDGKLHVKLFDHYGIKPIIDIRRSWKDGEETRAFEKVSGIVYSNRGEVFCISQRYGDQKAMVCQGKAYCQIPRQVRIPLEEDPCLPVGGRTRE